MGFTVCGTSTDGAGAENQLSEKSQAAAGFYMKLEFVHIEEAPLLFPSELNCLQSAFTALRICLNTAICRLLLGTAAQISV